jgi:glycosyltransferase involved in cell wall biosynthesis
LLLSWDFITPHYPPQDGGIADYTFAMAKALRRSGDAVTIWCPQASGKTPEIPGVGVHRIFKGFDARDLQQLNRAWKIRPEARRILLMYHPHGFGQHSLNLRFCFWLWKRAAFNGDRIVMILHEYAVDFKLGKYCLFATVHRAMLAVALRGTARVWCPVERWKKAARILALGRKIPIEWLPVFSTIPPAGDAEQVRAVRSSMVAEGEQLIGHFGTCPESVTCLLDRMIPSLLRLRQNCKVLLVGSGTDQYASGLRKAHPDLARRIRGLGAATSSSISVHLRACDVLVQPYIDGVNARRSSAMAALENGVPMITTRGRLTEPFWKDVFGVRVVPVDDLETAIRATGELLDEPHTRTSMSIAARTYYTTHFKLDYVIEQIRACEQGC